MPVVIQKFGGRLLETPGRIHKAAAFITATKSGGEDPVVVVSAPGRMTDQFIALARRVTPHPDERELDMLLSVGERTAMALLAMAINAGGKYRAVSFTGSQVGIITDTQHTNARIVEVKGYRLKESLARGEIPIVAGFQGVSTEREITTLGRGGSDTTAVALAVALGAGRCELVKEHGAVFSADPEIVPEAERIPEIDYQTLQSLTAAGAKVVQMRAASLAREHKVKLHIRDESGTPGTVVTDQSLDAGGVAAIVFDDQLVVQRTRKLTTEGTVLSVRYKRSRLDVVRDNGTGLGIPVALITLVGWNGRLDSDAVRIADETLLKGGWELVGAVWMGDRISFILPRAGAAKVLRLLHRRLVREGSIRVRGAERQRQVKGLS